MENILKRLNLIFALALIIIMLISILTNIKKTVETIDAAGDKPDRIRILLDPGHGGVDQGASGDLKIAEAPINLAIAKKLMSFLEGSGFEVEMTRYDDQGL
ncbi:MAG: N-acetylmuramoyl-L-alanine amidase, partial [Sedimentibacter sp.]|nr:N-acetylmuramoyl-L-alanine amidase [Sedimentibacter sp.]